MFSMFSVIPTTQIKVLQNLNIFLDTEAERLSLDEDEAEADGQRDLREIGGKEDSGEIGVVVSTLQDEIRALALDPDTDVSCTDVLDFLCLQCCSSPFILDSFHGSIYPMCLPRCGNYWYI